MKKKKADSFDTTLGYRPPARGRGIVDGGPPALQEPLAGVDEPTTPVPASTSDGASRGRRAVAGVLLCAGMLLILGFSFVSVLTGSFLGVPIHSEDPAYVSEASKMETLLPSAEAAEPEEGILLTVGNIAQEPELPNGCEVTSLAILLNYYGYKADKVDLAENYLVKSDFWAGEWGEMYAPSPEEAYPGSPGQYMLGYYCYPGVIVATGNKYFAGREAPYEVENLSGATTRHLRGLLDDEIPVIVWCTTDLLPLRTTAEFHWYTRQGGEPYYPYTNMHAMVLTGYDSEYYYFCDPLENYTQVPRAEFDDNYIEVGRRAVALTATEGA